MKKSILFIAFLACAMCFISCKEKEEEPEEVVLVNIIQGTITYEEELTGREGNASGATVDLHKGSEEKSILTVTANDKGFYQFTGILNDTYQVSSKFELNVNPPTTFTSRSDSIILKGNDTITCDIHMIK